MTVVAVTILAALAAVLAGTVLLRRRRDHRALRTADLLLALGQSDALAHLESETARSDTWWTDATPGARQAVDGALSSWDLVAALARGGRLDEHLVLEHFAAQVVDLWELAYPYVQHRREQHAALCHALGELYLDAYEVAGPRPARVPAAVAPQPDPAPAPPVEPAPTEPVASAAPPEPAPAAAAAPDLHQLLIAALRDVPPPDATAPTVTIDLTARAAGPAPRRPAPVAFEEVVDL